MNSKPTIKLLPVAALLTMGLSHQAAAGNYGYTGEFTTCLGTCDSFEALGGPGGASNPVPSEISGAIWVNATASDTWEFDDVALADDGDFFGSFAVSNAGAPPDPAVFAPDQDPRCDGLDAGILCNSTTANPLPLDSRVAEIRETATTPSQTYSTGGTTDANGELNSGTILFQFIVPPFSNNDAWVILDLDSGTGKVCLFFPASDCIPFATESVVIAGNWAALDSDEDGHTDPFDNCICVANADQRDTNMDGFGNICDADLDGNLTVTFGDLALFKAAFGEAGPGLDADFNGNGSVSFDDLATMKRGFIGPPGPANGNSFASGKWWEDC